MASSLAEGLRMWERTKPAQAEGLRMRLLKTLRKPKAYGCGSERRCASLFNPSYTLCCHLF